jgi:putative oxidoreductase
MTTKIKSLSVITARVVLGLIYFVFGLNFFLQFLPAPPQPQGAALNFVSGLFQAGYFFPFMKTIEVILGALLIIGFFVPVSLVVLMPITINVLLFHSFLSPGNALMSVVMIVLHLYLAWAYRDYFRVLLSLKTRPAL